MNPKSKYLRVRSTRKTRQPTTNPSQKPVTITLLSVIMQMDFSTTVTGEENRHSAGVSVALESRLRELIVQGMARLAGPVSKCYVVRRCLVILMMMIDDLPLYKYICRSYLTNHGLYTIHMSIPNNFITDKIISI